MIVQIELDETEVAKIAAILHERHIGQTKEHQKRSLELANKIVAQLCEHRNRGENKAGRPRREA